MCSNKFHIDWDFVDDKASMVQVVDDNDENHVENELVDDCNHQSTRSMMVDGSDEEREVKVGMSMVGVV